MKSLFNILIIIALFCRCTSNNKDLTKLSSDSFETLAERINILKNEIKAFSDIKDAEFELFNVNGFNEQRSSIPGPSSWDYRFVIRIDTANISAWTIGMTQIKSLDSIPNWTHELIKSRKHNWNTNSKPDFYVRDGENVIMLVYRNEGIVYKRVTNL